MWELTSGVDFWGINIKILKRSSNLEIINNFEPNPILVNVNKLKPYTYVE
jgi:hypothetical protein